MSLLDFRCLPELDGEYEAVVKSYKEVTNEKGGYVEVVLGLPDREYKYCIFPSQVEYATSCLNRQLGEKRDRYGLGEVLEELRSKQTKIKVNFFYNEEFGRINVALHSQVEEDEDITEDLL